MLCLRISSFIVPSIWGIEINSKHKVMILKFNAQILIFQCYSNLYLFIL